MLVYLLLIIILYRICNYLYYALFMIKCCTILMTLYHHVKLFLRKKTIKLAIRWALILNDLRLLKNEEFLYNFSRQCHVIVIFPDLSYIIHISKLFSKSFEIRKIINFLKCSKCILAVIHYNNKLISTDQKIHNSTLVKIPSKINTRKSVQ